MKVVVGVDGSDLSYQAVQFMGRVLSPKVDDLLLYFSAPKFQLSSKTAVSEDVIRNAGWALAAGVFETALSKLPPEMQEVTSAMRDEEVPSEGLIKLAEEEDVDLVVVGSKRAARKFPFLLGSTARTVVHHTGKPVMVVRGDNERPAGPMKVIIACDQDRWIDATGILRNFSWPDGTQATLFHVTESLGEAFVDALLTGGSSRVPNSQQLVAEYQAAVDKRNQEAASHLLSIQEAGPSIVRDAVVETAQGDIVDEIIEKVERENADLLVVSSRKLSTLGRMLGSVTESLLTRCPCTLLIVHDQPEPQATEEQKVKVTNALPE